MNFKHESVKIAITPAEPGAPVAIMHYLTLGRGDILPRGAQWFAKDAGIWARPATDDLVREQIERAYLGNGRPMPLSWAVLPEGAALPDDRTYRNAWVHHPVRGVEHDMAKARELHRNRLREARAPALAALDAEYLKADETADKKKKDDAAAKKQALRDVTAHPSIEAAQDIAALKACTLGLL